jgi:hypothetical protein
VPYSFDAFNSYIATAVTRLQPSNVCDVGPGAGKYGRIVRSIAAKEPFNTHLTAIEIDESYVERFKLRDIYDTIIVDDVMNIIKTPNVRFDLVIIGDCIEHLRKSDGVDLLNFLVYRTGYIFVVYPEAYIQDDWEGHISEAHLSTWRVEDFGGWKTVHHSWSGMHLFLVKGYQPTRTIIAGTDMMSIRSKAKSALDALDLLEPAKRLLARFRAKTAKQKNI